jgi:DNA repair photolyase
MATKGRGIDSNPAGRFEQWEREREYENGVPEEIPPVTTQLHVDRTKSVITSNNSPDVPFNKSINPYRGCEHGCVYCFARPTHSWLGFSPGLDFESQIVFKPDIVKLLRNELEKPGYRCEPVIIGTNTDAYQPVERKLKLTRGVLETFLEFKHPTGLITKSSLIERDTDLLQALAARQLAVVNISICTLQAELSRKMEPRAASPKRRLAIIEKLAKQGIPVNVLVAPVIPWLNDSEVEDILTQCKQAGAISAGYVLLRLPHELKTVFTQWLEQAEPLKAKRVMARLRECRGGRDYDSRFGKRLTGAGTYAGLLRKRFELALKRLDYGCAPELNSEYFSGGSRQMELL